MSTTLTLNDLFKETYSKHIKDHFDYSYGKSIDKLNIPIDEYFIVLETKPMGVGLFNIVQITTITTNKNKYRTNSSKEEIEKYFANREYNKALEKLL